MADDLAIGYINNQTEIQIGVEDFQLISLIKHDKIIALYLVVICAAKSEISLC